ncbi:hypothetical protein LOOC260_109730 [Paucilactobacillus hokkaidonensis JCM 18461]|uniref:Uncharacterized protein n=1 Tax=Paucilactobacillus hokkaidonensis JCM 18461 TaxID=1291742 RepID=A0A0A1GT87_9LACO|nr:hypothetical protein LOOC260_109730 [Paucilactobacillus hokkaidonensis JCM 18461]
MTTMTKHYAANEYMEEYHNLKTYKIKLSDGSSTVVKAPSEKQARAEMDHRFASISVMGINPPAIVEVSLDEESN